MFTTKFAKMTGAAAIMLAGVSSLAVAGSSDVHVMNVLLPDGRVQQIRYTGDVPPTIVMAPVESPFAAMDRMMAAMQQRMNAMMQLAAMPMTVSAGSGVCMRSMQVSFTGNGQPQVVSQTAGDCGPAAGPAPATLPNAPIQPTAPKTIEVKAEPKQIASGFRG
jgi:hypothetical protein